ncbi:MAG: hypothetical protein GX568_06475 [Candidatus Gastranaerophilales bacterium]|jgi:hypothetical protein|nr:hypothetical protein [Candidatus Gastranaerophilales bacterium]
MNGKSLTAVFIVTGMLIIGSMFAGIVGNLASNDANVNDVCVISAFNG